jgi:hypothetical protein
VKASPSGSSPAHGGLDLRLQLAYFDRSRAPITMDVGAVLDIEDVAGGKVCALASRVEPREYADTAATLKSYTPALPALSLEHHPARLRAAQCSSNQPQGLFRGGGGGNRTRVLQYLTRASPGAVCC